MSRIFQVDGVSINIQKTNPPTLLVAATGRVGTPGWKHLDLVPLETPLSPDGILDLEFTGDPPTGIVPAIVTAVSADFMTQTDVEKIVGVQVHARTNSMSAFVSAIPDPSAAMLQQRLQLGDPTPWQLRLAMMNEMVRRGDLTTQTLGEEEPTNTVAELGTVPDMGETPPLSFHSEKIAKMGEKNANGEHNEGAFNTNMAVTAAFNAPFGKR